MLPKISSAGTLFFLHGCCRRLAGALLRRSLSTAASKPHFMVDYLISSCGFSSAEAVKASKRVSHLKSTHKPDSVLDFMRSHGFNDAQLRKLIRRHPKLLCYDVDRTLKPKFQSLRDWGLSDSDLSALLVSSNNLLFSSMEGTVLPRLKFWESLLGSKEKLMGLFKRNFNWFLGRDIDKWVKPNICLLHDFGISNEKIAVVLRLRPDFVIQSPENFRLDVQRVERLGVPRSSGMFLWAVSFLYRVTEARFNDTKQLMRSFGWSDAEFVSAFRKTPAICTNSLEMLSKKMDFLVKEVGCKPSEVSRYPVLLTLSLERRLIPRHHVLQVLSSKGLLCQDYKPGNYMVSSNKVFMKEFVTPYQEKLPEVQEIYMASSSKEHAL